MISQHIQNIIVTFKHASVCSAETHRLSTISNIENALAAETFTDEQAKRLRRLLRTLDASAVDSPQRKYDVIDCNIIPTLIHMGLAEKKE